MDDGPTGQGPVKNNLDTLHFFAHLKGLSHEKLAEWIGQLPGKNFESYRTAFSNDGISGAEFAPVLEACTEKNEYRPLTNFFRDINETISKFAARKLWHHLRDPALQPSGSKVQPTSPNLGRGPQPQQQQQQQHQQQQTPQLPPPSQFIPPHINPHQYQQPSQTLKEPVSHLPTHPAWHANGSAVRGNNNNSNNNVPNTALNNTYPGVNTYPRVVHTQPNQFQSRSLNAPQPGLQQPPHQRQGVHPHEAANRSLGVEHQGDVHQSSGQVYNHHHHQDSGHSDVVRRANAEQPRQQQKRRSLSPSSTHHVQSPHVSKQQRPSAGSNTNTGGSSQRTTTTSSHYALTDPILLDINLEVDPINFFAKSNVGNKTQEIAIPQKWRQR